MPEPISVIATIVAKEGTEDAIQSALQEIKDRTPSEGALQYDIERTGSTFRVIEKWPSLRVLKEDHLGTPAFEETYGGNIAPNLVGELGLELERGGVKITLDAPYDD